MTATLHRGETYLHPFVAYARENDLHIRHIVETHVHADFVCGSRELKARLNDEPTIHCSGYGGDEFTLRDLVRELGEELREFRREYQKSNGASDSLTEGR